MTEAETGGMQTQTKDPEDCWQLRSCKRHEGFSPGAFRGSLALPTPDVRLQTSPTTRYNFLLFRWPNLWYLVTAALGHEHRA